ncbi:MAG: WXG100 family type VII secretion target [Microbacterium sp.]|uniref:WXG100 family type VII secretion target n=1 Tax=Microbacterium sp. TaxID=51671 RepID=UPI00262167F0|nr:WXG100 family type VII secretion target [Microbacterium sp.]MCX6502521.1 WXG100 family type VII secretion target [Microbacterium sp.]
MADLKVSPEGLSAAAAALKQESARIEAVLAGLEQEANRLRGNWDGAARVAYDLAQREWSTTFAHMKSVLASIAEATQQIGENYVEADKRSAKLFRR